MSNTPDDGWGDLTYWIEDNDKPLPTPDELPDETLVIFLGGAPYEVGQAVEVTTLGELRAGRVDE